MNNYLKRFLHRGLMAASGGPIILGIIYWIEGTAALPGREVFLGIVTTSLLAFVAAGISVVYQIERIPLLPATMLHSGGLLTAYLTIYLINGWLQPKNIPWFLVIFCSLYAVIWTIVTLSVRHSVQRVNQKMKSDA